MGYGINRNPLNLRVKKCLPFKEGRHVYPQNFYLTVKITVDVIAGL
jgi:hypothetical protein